MKQLIDQLAQELSIEITWLENVHPDGFETTPAEIHRLLGALHKTDGLYFDHLMCLTGIDNGPEAGTMEVVYHLCSIPYGHQLTVRATIQRGLPEIQSVADIWQTANWHEREAFDLVGIKFLNHPDLRRILLPGDWEGHPLQKDYKEQEKYHGITVAYDTNGE